MKKYTLISLFILVVLSLIPPLDIVLHNPQPKYWLWMILIAGFAGVYTIFLKTNIFVKVIAIGTFIDCFFSAAPYMSFTSYCSVVLCCYFYIACTKIEDWKIIFYVAQSILLLNAILLILEFFHKDSLMDWGQAQTINFGVIGHHMQMGSFAVILTSFLLPFSMLNLVFPLMISLFAKSTWTFLCAGMGVFTYRFFNHKDNRNSLSAAFIVFMIIFCIWDIRLGKFTDNIDSFSGRSTVWGKTFELSNKHPLVGWGPGTYKQIFAPLSRMQSIPYKTAHNFIAQLIFEIGYPLTGYVLFALGCLFKALYSNKLWLLLSGLTMMVMDALVHFPDRQLQCVPIIIIFLAYCSVRLKNGVKTCPSY